MIAEQQLLVLCRTYTNLAHGRYVFSVYATVPGQGPGAAQQVEFIVNTLGPIFSGVTLANRCATHVHGSSCGNLIRRSCL